MYLIDGIELDLNHFEDADPKIKMLAEVVSELIDALKLSFKNL